MQLTKNISLEEMTASFEALTHQIDNLPDKEQIQNMMKLAQKVLQPTRDHFDKAIIIGPRHSGFRCKELNALVGGVDTSQHPKGEAADFHIDDTPLKDVFLFIKDNLQFDQLIYEFGSWIHASYSEGHNRKQVLVSTKINGKTVYLAYESEDQLT